VIRADESSFEISTVISPEGIVMWPHREERASAPSATDFLTSPWPRGLFTMQWNALSNRSSKTADSFVAPDERSTAHGGASDASELPDVDLNNYATALTGVNIHSILRLSVQTLLATTSAGLRLSDDAGNSWRVVGGALESNTIQAICRHPRRASTLFAASHGLIYMSADSGRSWSQLFTDGLPIGSVKQIIVAAGPRDQLLVLTRQHGVYTIGLHSPKPQVSR
jgi:hypothetical protein